jgi:hypothetical protein
LDNILFSDQPIPEPGVLGFFMLEFLVLPELPGDFSLAGLRDRKEEESFRKESWVNPA